MKYLAAYALLSLSGKKDISKFIFYEDAGDIKKVLGEVSATVSDADINRVIESLKGKKVHELIAQGIANIAPPSGASSAPTAAKTAVVKEEPKK